MGDRSEWVRACLESSWIFQNPGADELTGIAQIDPNVRITQPGAQAERRSSHRTGPRMLAAMAVMVRKLDAAGMKKHFKAVRIALLMAALAIVGAVGGSVLRARMSSGSRDPVVSQVQPEPRGRSADSDDHGSDDQSSSGAAADEALTSTLDRPNWPLDSPSESAASVPVGVLLGSGTQAAANAILHGDLMLQEGRVSEAVRHFRRLLAEAVTETAMMEVRYRLALCAEALSNDEEALANYQAIVQAEDTGILGELAWLGQARIFARRRQFSAAQQLLRLWVLLEHEAALRSVPVSRVALYLLGAMSANEVLSDTQIPLWDDNGLAQPHSVFEPSEHLPDAFTAEERGPVEIPVGIQLLHQLQPSDPGSSYYQGRLARTSVHRVLQQLCAGPNWTLEFTPVADKALRSQTIQLNFSEKSADVLLDLLLAPLGIAWTFAEGRLKVLAESELPPAEAKRYRLNLAERMLFFALLADPNHQQSPAAYLLLGNLSFQGGDLATARRHFENILQTFPRSSVAAEAWFNAGKVAIAEGNMDRARQTLLGAVDVTRGNPLEPVALLLSARSELLFDEPLKAVRPLVRAVTLAADDDVRALSLLTLASAHLMAGHPESANLALMEDRHLLQQDPYRDRAALLAGLARFRAASIPWRIERDGRSLITALSHVQPEPWASLHDHLLTAEAYDALGLSDLAAPVLESAVRVSAPSPLRTRIQFRLAEIHVARSDFERAEIALAALAEDPSPEVASQSLINLAELHVRCHEVDRAERICRDLLQKSLSEEHRIGVLKLLGGIYARRGDRERAVLCFSGVAPQLFEATLRTPPPEAGGNSPGRLDSPVSMDEEGGL